MFNLSVDHKIKQFVAGRICFEGDLLRISSEVNSVLTPGWQSGWMPTWVIGVRLYFFILLSWFSDPGGFH
jgi:hypothetical protein